MRILLVADALLIGGAEWMIVRVANYCKNDGNEVCIYSLRPDKVNTQLLANLDAIQINHAPKALIRLLILFDRVYNKLFGSMVFTDAVNAYFLKKAILKFKPNVIHSHLLPSDFVTVLANRKTKINHVTTIHGDYTHHIKNKVNKLFDKMRFTLSNINHIIIISEEQRLYLTEFVPDEVNKIEKIYNGYPIVNDLVDRKNDSKFKFGMIARGLPEKGWAQAIEAFKNIKNDNVRLQLYGQSQHLDTLKETNTDNRIEFMGYTSNPIDAIRNFDVGLFPSYYKAESLPTTIIEYLIMRKPVITTNIGECEEMIRVDSEYAGLVVPLNSQNDVNIELFTESMMLMINEHDRYKHFCDLTEVAKQKFDINKSMNRYYIAYNSKNVLS